ncbi:MAG TPA: hypothetical protein VK902_18875 [Rubrobacter sp.]|jgi:hypothetical protein|nr:hypothetical protein [Rubrobacter sp.]
MPDQRSFGERLMFGGEHGRRAEREEKVLRYVDHRLDEEAHLHDVLRESYVRSNCTQQEVDKIIRNPELVHACRERLERAFGSGELDPRTHGKP